MSYRDQECDAQGRILLPAKLRKYILEDKKEFEIAGAHNSVRITVAQVAVEKLLDVKANMDSIMAEMDDVSIKLALQSMQL
jgi:DNA-binding transcriptional regulator/RsmH inhibitor MraZ